jgi:hypothetical protein
MNQLRPLSGSGSSRQRKVFAKRRPRPQRFAWRQGLEGILLLSLGVGLLAFLNWLPQRIDALVVVSEAIADLISGVSQLLEAFLGIGAVLLLAGLLLVSLVTLVAGFVRILRALSRSFATAKPTPEARHPGSRR